MPGTIITYQTTGVAISVAVDLFEIPVPALVSMRLLEFGIFQTSDVGDAAELIERILIRRQTGTLTSGSGGSSPTGVLTRTGDTNPLTAVEANNTTLATGTLEDLPPLGWNIRVPLEKIWLHDVAPIFEASEDLIIRLPDTPGSPITCSAYVVVEV